MTMRNLFLTAIAATAVGAAASTARAGSIQPIAPPWCGSYQAEPYDTMYKYLDDYSKNGFTDRFMVTLAKTACDKPGDPGRQKAVAAWREKFDAYYHLTEAENRELLEVSLAGTLEPAATKICNHLFDTTGRASNDSATRTVLVSARKMLGCNAALDESITWWVDDGTEIDDPIVKLVWIDREMWQARQGKLGACGDRMRKHLAAYVDAKQPASKKAAIDALTDPIGYRLSLAAMLCDSASNDMTQFAIQHMLEAAKLRRGPRVHMYYALLGLGDTVPGFDPKYMGYLDDKALRELLHIPHLGDVSWAERTGIVAGLSAKKDGVLVTFKTSRWTEAVWNCVTTHRIDHFENGRAVYYQDCHPTGKSMGMSSTEKPVLIAKSHAHDLKVGQFVSFVADTRNRPAVAGPTFGYTKSDQKKLVSIFGIKL
jgi:hypothetical protein